MAGESNLSSLLAQSKSRTDAAVSGVKKQNRRASQARIVGAGLELYDSFSKGKAKKRADEFFSTAMLMVDNTLADFDDAVTFINKHNDRYGVDNPNWKDMFYKEQAGYFLDQNSIVDNRPQSGADLAEINRTQREADETQLAQEMQNPNSIHGTFYTERLADYEELYNNYSSESFASGNIGVSDERRDLTRKTIKDSYETSIRKTYDELRSRGGVLPDLLARFGIQPKYEDVYYTAEKVIQVPPDLSPATNNYLTSLRNNVERSGYLDKLTGRISFVDENPNTQNLFLQRVGTENDDIPVSGDIDYDNAKITSYYTPAGNATPDPENPAKFYIDRLNNTWVESGGVSMPLNQSIILYTENDEGNLVPAEYVDGKGNIQTTTLATLFEVATPDQQMALLRSIGGQSTMVASAFKNVAEELRDLETQQDTINNLTDYENSPTLIAEILFGTGDYRDILGIQNNPNAEGGIDILRVTEDRDRTSQYYMGLAAVENLTGLQLSLNLQNASDTLQWAVRNNTNINLSDGIIAMFADKVNAVADKVIRSTDYNNLAIEGGSIVGGNVIVVGGTETGIGTGTETVTPLPYGERLLKEREEEQARVSKISELTDTYKLSSTFLRQLEEDSVDPDQIENIFVKELANNAVLQMESTGLLSPMSWTTDPEHETGMPFSEYLVLGTPEKITEKINDVIGYQARLAVQNSQDKEGITTLTTSIKDALRVSLEGAIELLKAKQISSSGLFEGDNLTPDEEINVLELWIQRL